jgi:hypothetical protein
LNLPTVENHSSHAARWWLGTLLAASALYGFTMAPGQLWSDSAEYQWRIAVGDWRGPDNLVRSHVLFILLAHGLHRAADLAPALAGNVVAALAAAFTLANVAAIVYLLGRSRLAIVASVSALATAHAFWQMATISEVYTLTTALMSGAVLCIVCFSRTRSPWLVALCGTLNGLDIANHNQGLITLACLVSVGIAAGRSRLFHRPSLVVATTVCWLAGLAPLFWLAYVTTEGQTVAQVARDWLVGPFQSDVMSAQVTAGVLGRAAAAIGLSFPNAAVLLVLFGIRPLLQLQRRWIAGLTLLLLAAHFGFVVRYNVHDQYTFFLPSYVMMAIVMAFGLDRLRAARGWRPQLRAVAIGSLFWSPVVYAVLPPLIAALPPGVSPLPDWQVPYRDSVRWFIHPWHTGYEGTARFVREAFAVLPDDAVVLIDETQGYALSYGQVVAGLAPRVQINSRRPEGSDEPLTASNIERWVDEGRMFSGLPASRIFADPSVGGTRLLVGYRLEAAGVLSRVIGSPKPVSSEIFPERHDENIPVGGR